jgi:ketoreductase RED1
LTATTPSAVLAASDVLRRSEHVTVIGAGVIGISWTALFLAHGLEVRVNDPDPAVEDRVRAGIDQIAATLGELGLPTERLAARLEFEADLERAVETADVVQENGPEDLAFKRELWARVGRVVAPTALLLSSTSGHPATTQATDMVDPSRLLVGHPFNPPHLVPLVEVVPGERTDPAAVEDAVAFYTALGKRPLVVRREMPGFVANRLQSALFQESVHLVAEGVVSMEDLDSIVTSSIGLRWAAAGPFLTFHLGGGPGGLPHFLAHLGPGLEARWKSLGHPRLDEATVELLTDHVRRAYGAMPHDALERRRDRMQLAIMRALADASAQAPVAQDTASQAAKPRTRELPDGGTA